MKTIEVSKKTPEGWYYGWVVVAACVASAIASGPGHSFGINEFVDHFIEDLHISRTGISTAWLIASWTSASLVGLAGAALDHFGSRRLLCVVCFPYVLVIFLLQFVDSLSALTALVTCMRFLGPECLILTAQTTVNIWFIRKRGQASAALGLSKLLFNAEPMMFAVIIESLGWRRTYGVIAPTCASLLAVAICLMRDSPEQYGLLPDGDIKCDSENDSIDSEHETKSLITGDKNKNDATKDEIVPIVSDNNNEVEPKTDMLINFDESSSVAIVDKIVPNGSNHNIEFELETQILINCDESNRDATADETVAGGSIKSGTNLDHVELEGAELRWALRQPVFWILATSDVAEWMAWSALNYHISDLVQMQAGLDPARTARIVYAPLSTITAFVSLLVGFFVIDQLSTRRRVQINALAKILFSFVTHSTLYMSNEMSVGLFAAFWGCAMGCSGCTGAILHASIFGRRALGKIKGIATGLGLASSGMGVMLFGLSRDYTGSYASGINGLSLIIVIAAVALFCAPIPVWQKEPINPVPLNSKHSSSVAPQPVVYGISTCDVESDG